MRTFIKMLAVALLATGSAQASTTNLFTNGSFETYTGALNSAGWNFFTSAQVDGWTGTPKIELQTQRTIGLTPQDGRTYAELDTSVNSTLSQSLLLNAGRYEMSFWYSPRVQNGPLGTNDMSYSVAGTGVSAGGEIRNAPNQTYPWRSWTEVVTSFVVGADNTNVLFSFAALGPSRGDSCGNCGALIDNVSLTVAPIPLPAGAVLLLSAIGGLGLARRRGRKTA